VQGRSQKLLWVGARVKKNLLVKTNILNFYFFTFLFIYLGIEGGLAWHIMPP
jgi:hypothetical protein